MPQAWPSYLCSGNIESAGARLVALASRSAFGFLRELGERQRAHDVTLLRLLARLVVHRPVVLRAGDHLASRRSSRPRARPPTTARRSCAARRPSKPAPVPTLPGPRAAVAEVDGDDVVGLSREHPGRSLHGAAAELQLDDVRVVAVAGGRVAMPPSFAAVAGLMNAAFSHVILRERLRQLLQPAVVREAAVADARVGPEHDLEPAARPAASEPAPSRRPRPSPASAANAVPATTPSWSARFQRRSKSRLAGLRLPVARARSRRPSARSPRR